MGAKASGRMLSTAERTYHSLDGNKVLSLLIWVLPQQTWRGSCQQSQLSAETSSSCHSHSSAHQLWDAFPGKEIVLNKTCLFFYLLSWNNLLWTQPNSDRACLNSQDKTKILYSAMMNKWRRTETGEDLAVQNRCPSESTSSYETGFL